MILTASALCVLCAALALTGCTVGNDIDMNEVVDGYGYTVEVVFDGMGGLWNNHYDKKVIKVKPNEYLPEPGVSNASAFPAPLLTRGIIIGWYTEAGDGDVWSEDALWDFQTDRVGSDDFTLYCRWDVTKAVVVHQDSITYSLEVSHTEGRYLWAIPEDSPISTDKSKSFSHYSFEPDGEEIPYEEIEIDGKLRRAVDLTEMFETKNDVDVYVVWSIKFTEVATLAQLQSAAAENANIRLTEDIDMGGRSSPFANIDYSGVFDGGGHTVSNISAIPGGGTTGFFSSLKGATVRNVKFADITITVTVRKATDKTGTAVVGILAGRIEEGTVINNVSFENCSIGKNISPAVADGWKIVTSGWYGSSAVDVGAFTVSGTEGITVPDGAVKE